MGYHMGSLPQNPGFPNEFFQVSNHPEYLPGRNHLGELFRMKGILMKEQRETRILANQCDYRRSAVFGPTATVAKQDV